MSVNKLFVSIVIVFVVVASALVFQATRAGTSHVLTPSELSDIKDGGDKLRIRVAGKVSANEISYAVEPRIELRFSVEDPGTGGEKSIPVFYPGIKPDMFAVGRDVIIDGDFKSGTLIASKLQTQCPSKYEPPPIDKMYPPQS